MQHLVIESPPTADGKTRQFSAVLLAYIRADLLWDGGQANTQTIRPIYLVVAGTESGLRPFLANLRVGRKAEVRGDNTPQWRKGDRLELLRSAGYVHAWQRGDKQHIVTIYLPSLFNVNPGMIDKSVCSFISAPPEWWVREQGATLQRYPDICASVLHHARRLGMDGSNDEILATLPQAAHYCMYLDRRTRRPLINDLAFCHHLYHSALAEGIASVGREKKGASYHRWADSFECVDVERVGLDRPVITHTSQDEIDNFLIRRINAWTSN